MGKRRLYVNKINKKINNNQNSCDISLIKDNTINNSITRELSVDDKLKELFNTNGYVFNIDVKIITDDKTYNTKVVSRVGNSIITLDKDIINIKDIKDIIF